MLEVVDRHARAQGDCQHVDPLVHAVPAEDLTAEQLAVGRGEQHLEEQRRGARVVGGVAVLVGVDLAEVDARGPQLCLGHPGATGGHVEHLDHGGPLGAPVLTLVSGDRLGRDPAAPVRRAGQHREGGFAGQEVPGLDGVAGSQDVGC